MSGASPVLEDDSLFSRLDRQLFRIETALALFGGFAAFSLLLLAVVSVTGRNAFGTPLEGYVDWIEQLMPIIAILGISYVQRVGGHIRMDIVVGNLRGRALWLAELLTTCAALVLVALLIWGSWSHFLRSFDWGSPLYSRDSTMDIGLPIWPAKLLVPLALTVLSLRLILQIWAFTRAVITKDPRPVAVPMIEDVATQASHESGHLTDHDT